MSQIFVEESDVTIGIESNRCVVKGADGIRAEIPIEILEGITILGRAQITTQCIQECLKRGIPVSFFSKGGSYFGRLQSTGHVNTERQRKQCRLYESDFAVQLARSIVSAKLKNQSVVLKRYEKSRGISVQESLKMIRICRAKCLHCEGISELIGYEGQGAKAYFDGLAKLVEPDFYFQGRSKRPPLDAFNSMINLGYFVLRSELLGQIEAKGLNPYFGFMHKDREKHPTLASDMMEEWRAVLVDATVMSMINGHEIHMEDFQVDADSGWNLTREGIKRFMGKLDRKFWTEARYISYADYEVSFRQAIALQLDMLVRAIEAEDASIYKPVVIR